MGRIIVFVAFLLSGFALGTGLGYIMYVLHAG